MLSDPWTQNKQKTTQRMCQFYCLQKYTFNNNNNIYNIFELKEIRDIMQTVTLKS